MIQPIASRSIILLSVCAAFLVLRIALYPVCVALFEQQMPPAQALKMHWLWVLLGVTAGFLASALLWAQKENVWNRVPLSRLETLFLLFCGIAWTAPMLLDAGAMMGDDWYTGQRAIVPFRQALEHGEFPGWSFRYGNGSAYALQYPPLAFFINAVLSLTGFLSTETAMKLTLLIFQAVFTAGAYLLCRFFGTQRSSAAAAAIAISWTQQYWATAFLHGASASFVAVGLLPHVFRFFLLCLRNARPVNGVALGLCMGLVVLAQPVVAYFSIWFLGLILVFWVWRMGFPARKAFLSVALAAGLSVLISAPFLANVVWLRSFNFYSFGQKLGPVEPLSWLRLLWWNPRIGTPPGLGWDNSGYLGAGLTAGVLLYFFSPLRNAVAPGCKVLGWWLLAATLLIYGSRTPPVESFPFLHLAKGAYRIWPFLALPLMGCFALAIDWLRESGKRRWAFGLVLVALLENSPFPLKTIFRPPLPVAQTLETELPFSSHQSLFLILPPQQDFLAYQSVYRWITHSGRSDLAYHHHEDIGVIGSRYWETTDAIAAGPSHPGYNRAVDFVKWLRVTDVLIIGHSPNEYSALGPSRYLVAGGAPLTLVQVAGPAPMDRGRLSATIRVLPEEIDASGSARLPVSFYPFLRVQTVDGACNALHLSNDSGYARVCCFSQECSREIIVSAGFPVWWKALFILSCSSLIAALFFVFRRSKSIATG
ncbi:hypothetical protein QQ054_32715 [Oscillatoria amoena NRMC-F 0135]|nr:hypothetical protein [Oscillatoria amoena NRMC-F 0135]